MQTISSWKCRNGVIVIPKTFIGGDWPIDLDFHLMNTNIFPVTISKGDEIGAVIFTDMKQVKSYTIENVYNDMTEEARDSWSNTFDE